VSTWTRVFAMLVGFAVLLFAGLRWLESRSAKQLERLNKEKTMKKIQRTRYVIGIGSISAYDYKFSM